MLTRTPKRDSRRGGSMVEFALTMPLLLILSVAAADFARLFVESSTLMGASTLAVKYGAQNNIKSGEYAQMETLAGNSSNQVPNATPKAERLCDCPDAPGSWVDCLSASCPSGYGLPRAYVRVGMSKTFSTLGFYPGIPQNTDVNMRGWMRVQ